MKIQEEKNIYTEEITSSGVISNIFSPQQPTKIRRAIYVYESVYKYNDI